MSPTQTARIEFPEINRPIGRPTGEVVPFPVQNTEEVGPKPDYQGMTGMQAILAEFNRTSRLSTDNRPRSLEEIFRRIACQPEGSISVITVEDRICPRLAGQIRRYDGAATLIVVTGQWGAYESILDQMNDRFNHHVVCKKPENAEDAVREARDHAAKGARTIHIRAYPS